jgi:hypothetical protein
MVVSHPIRISLSLMKRGNGPIKYAHGGGGAVALVFLNNHCGSGAVAVDYLWRPMQKYMFLNRNSMFATAKL